VSGRTAAVDAALRSMRRGWQGVGRHASDTRPACVGGHFDEFDPTGGDTMTDPDPVPGRPAAAGVVDGGTAGRRLPRLPPPDPGGRPDRIVRRRVGVRGLRDGGGDVNDPERVVGYCPFGCGRTLFLAEGGYVTCSLVGCPRPDAVVDLLADDEAEHVVEVGESEFTVRHPLRERLDEALMRCDLHRWMAALPGPPRQPGRYRVVADPRRTWRFVPVVRDR
jgi:hypothetical protein